MSRMIRSIASVGILLMMMMTGCVSFTRAPRSTVLWSYPHSAERTLTQSSQEHYQAVAAVAERDARALIEDFDLLFLTDRPTRLTRWHDR